MNLYLFQSLGMTHAYGGNGFLVIAADTLEEAKSLLQPFVKAEDLMSGEDNEKVLEFLNRDVVVASHAIEPPGDWDGDCYRINWEELMALSPRVIPLDRPRIAAYYYGYEG